jgi:hypothetical protein
MTVSTQNSNNPTGYTRSPEANLYTVLLIIALLALLTGILYLHLELKAYEYKAATASLSMIRAEVAPDGPSIAACAPSAGAVLRVGLSMSVSRSIISNHG